MIDAGTLQRPGLRVAALVDGDNIAVTHAATIHAEAASLGRVDVARVYGDALGRAGWLNTCGFRFVHAGNGKNAADLLLSIEAIELALLGGIEGFVIASSDSDFLHLALRLRERGLTVVGVGEAKTPQTYRAACTRFVELAHIAGSAPTPVLPKCTLDTRIAAVVTKRDPKGKGLPLVQFGTAMRHDEQVTTAMLKEANWRKYFEARPQLYDLEICADGARVRILRSGSAGAPA